MERSCCHKNKEGVCEKCEVSEGRESCLNSSAGLNWFDQKGHESKLHNNLHKLKANCTITKRQSKNIF